MVPQRRPRQENNGGGGLHRKVLVFLTLVAFKAAIRLGIAIITHSTPSSVSMTADGNYSLILFYVFETLIWTIYMLTLYAMAVIVFALHRTEARWLLIPLLPLHIAFDMHFYSLKPLEYWGSSTLHNVPPISLALASIVVAVIEFRARSCAYARDH